MRSALAILSATLLLLAGASTAFAKATSHKVEGEVASIDATARTLSVTPHSKATHPNAMTFSLASDAKIMSGPKVEEFGNLKVGDPVTVTYVTRGKSNTATRIDLRKAAATAPAKKTGY